MEKLGIISPANSIIGEKSVEQFNKGIKKLQECGFEIIIGNNVYSNTLGYCGTIDEKLEDIYEVCEKCKYVICSTGGINANVLLEKLDFSKIKDNIFIGNSNPVLLFNAFYEINKQISYIGPNVKSLGKDDDLFPVNCLKNKIMNGSKEVETEKENVIVKFGNASGISIGGNIQSLRRIIGLKCFPKVKKYILYLEADPTETNVTEYESIISQFKQADIIKNAQGIIIGSSNYDKNYYLKLFRDFNGPIIICENLGHNIHNNVMPIGKNIKINGNKISEE